MKYLAIISCIIVLSFKATTQVTWEPTLGTNYAWINYFGGAGESHKPGFRPVGGIGADIYLTTGWSFKPKVLYSIKGVNSRNVSGLRSSEWNSYLDTPLDINFSIKPSIRVFAGVNIGYWINGWKISTSQNGNRLTTTFNPKIEDANGHYNLLDLAPRIGVSLDSPFLKENLKWYISYSHGLVPLYQPDLPADNHHYDYNRWFQILLYYPINIK